LASVLDAALLPGAAWFATETKLSEALATAQAVVIGEGRFDATSLDGKVASAVIAAARARGLPVWALVGTSAPVEARIASSRSAAPTTRDGRMRSVSSSLSPMAGDHSTGQDGRSCSCSSSRARQTRTLRPLAVMTPRRPTILGRDLHACRQPHVDAPPSERRELFVQRDVRGDGGPEPPVDVPDCEAQFVADVTADDTDCYRKVNGPCRSTSTSVRGGTFYRHTKPNFPLELFATRG
jgi:hypothetical protein